MKQQTLGLTVLLLTILGASVVLLWHMAPQPIKISPPEPPEMYMFHAKVQKMNQTGQLEQRLTAPYWEYYNDDKASYLAQPQLVHYNPEDAPWTVQADMGAAHSDKVIHLIGQVKMHQPESTHHKETLIRTSRAKVLPPQQYAVTHAPVDVIQKGARIQAVGAKIYYKQRKLELLSNARGYYDPVQTPLP